MDTLHTLQSQVIELREKMDSLYKLNEQISDRVKDLGSQQPQRPEHDSYSLPSFALGSAMASSLDGESEYQLTHKDILVDDNSSSNSANSNNENLAPDTQIRRLTAQLTAAYNRIAALEEQLLSYRIHS